MRANPERARQNSKIVIDRWQHSKRGTIAPSLSFNTLDKSPLNSENKLAGTLAV